MGNQFIKTGLGASFYSINCTMSKDHYQLDLTKTRWLDIKRYHKTTRGLEAEFDMNFIIQTRNSDFGPIYPKHVNLKGKIKTVATLFE